MVWQDIMFQNVKVLCEIPKEGQRKREILQNDLLFFYFTTAAGAIQWSPDGEIWKRRRKVQDKIVQNTKKHPFRRGTGAKAQI
jgi:hypothetical protein